MKKGVLVYYIMFLCFEVLIFLFFMLALLASFDPRTKISSVAVAIILILNVATIIIDIAGIKKKADCVLNLLVKVTVFFVGMMTISICFKSIEGVMVFLVIALMLGCIVPYRVKYLKENIKKAYAVKETTGKRSLTGMPDHEFSYKGKWAWEDAAKEYMKKTGKGSFDELDDDDDDLIYDYSMMPVAYYFAWIIEKGFLTKNFDIDAKIVKQCKKREITPIDLFDIMDYVLDDSDLSDMGAAFTHFYFYGEEATNDSDYRAETKNPDDFIYCVDYSWDIYDKMKVRFDAAWDKWEIYRQR